MSFAKMSISSKLTAGFGLCVLLLIVVVGYNFSALGKLDNLYLETMKHSEDMELATDAQHLGQDLYMIIANAMVNRDLAKSERDWASGKKENQAILQKVAAVADKPDEQAKVRQARKEFDDIIRIYEEEMLPLIKNGAGIPGHLADIDTRIDRKVAAIDLALQWVARSISDDNQKAAREFHAVLISTIRFGMAISLIGVIAVLTVSVLTNRLIVRPLAEMTLSATALEKGNYSVELKHRSGDETGILADAFRDMQRKVEERTVELQESNELLHHEVSERKTAEEEIRRLNTDLEQRVMERTMELVITNDHLNELIAAQKEAEAEILGSREELRSLSHHLETVREEERTAIAREVHDELGQLLTALKMDVSWLGGKLPEEQRHLVKKTREMARHIDETIKTVQKISAELRPGILDDLGLIEAIEWQAKEFQKRTGIICEFHGTLEGGKLDRSRSTALFRIFQETLTNIYRHAEASRAWLTLTGRDNELIATVTDNGKGITKKQISNPTSLGFIGMRERVRYFGGEVTINRIPDGGTTIEVIIPLDGKEKEKQDDQDTHRG